jgi:hypothetical protein
MTVDKAKLHLPGGFEIFTELGGKREEQRLLHRRYGFNIAISSFGKPG